MSQSKKKHKSYSNSYGSAHRSRKRRAGRNNTPILMGVGAVVVLLIIFCVVFKLRGNGGDEPESVSAEESTTEDNSTIKHDAVIDLNSIIGSESGIADDNRISIRGMTAEEISAAIADKYTWKLSLVNSDARVGDVVKPRADLDQTTEAATLGDPENPDSDNGTEESTYSDITVADKINVPDYIAERIPAFVEQIFEADRAKRSAESTEADNADDSDTEAESTAGNASSDENVYTFTLDGLEDEIDNLADYAVNMWYVEPLGGSIGSYNKDTDTFVMENSRNGFEPDRDKLISDIKSAVSNKDYSGEIAVSGTSLSAESSANVPGPYKTIATYTTKTTSNAVRNKNIQIACNKLNGTIVRPGEEFSFNNTVGQRTKEAGYGEAAAYNNGEVVQEVGGGVCQVSSTLYNAVLKAGLKITARRSHTFKPTYVTPGQDATISWGGPDFRFANVPNKPEYSYKSSYAIGIRASYSDQTVTVSIYARPVLKDGYSFSLESTQTKTIDMVRKAIEPGSDRTPAKGSEGSQWETRLIVKKDGEVVSNSVDHNALYSGHIEYYYEEQPTESTAESESESESVSEPASESSMPAGPGEAVTSKAEEQTEAPTISEEGSYREPSGGDSVISSGAPGDGEPSSGDAPGM